MEIRITLPSAIEGEWKFEEPNTLVITPFFYKKIRTQTLMHIARIGEHGKRRDCCINIDAARAGLSVHEDTETPVKIKPFFDNPPNPSKKKL